MAPPLSSRDPNMADIDAMRDISARHGDKPDALLEILHEIQERLGFVPSSAPEFLAKSLNISRAEAHGVISFYHDFRHEKPGRHVVKLCRAEACQSMGCRSLENHAKSRLKIGFGETTVDRRITLDAVYCFGNCALSPAVMIDGELHGRMSIDKLDGLLAMLE